MAERNVYILTGVAVSAVLAAVSAGFMFVSVIRLDYTRQVLESTQERISAQEIRRRTLQNEEGVGLTALNNESRSLDTLIQKTESDKEEATNLLRRAEQDLSDARGRVQPAVKSLHKTASDRFTEVTELDRAIQESRASHDRELRHINEAIQSANRSLGNTSSELEEQEKGLDLDINQLRSRFAEVSARLSRVSAEALRRDVISDAGGEVLRAGDGQSRHVIVNLGNIDRIRRGLKFTVWSLKRGYGLGWVQVQGRNFLEENVLPGDWLIVGKGANEVRYQVLSVGINRDSETRGIGLARSPAPDTLKIIGPGVTPSFTVAGQEWKIETASTASLGASPGVEVKGMIEITSVRSTTSDAVILPERVRQSTCPQCGWEAHERDMRYCVYCGIGDRDLEVQPLDEPPVRVLNKAENPFNRIAAGDRLSNPLFSPNKPLIFVLGSQMVSRGRQEMQTFIEANGGRIIDAQVLLTPLDVDDAAKAQGGLQAYDINYLMPGVGPDAEPLLRRARDLGINVMREDEIFEFFGAASL